MSRAFSRQEAGAVGDDLPALRFRAPDRAHFRHRIAPGERVSRADDEHARGGRDTRGEDYGESGRDDRERERKIGVNRGVEANGNRLVYSGRTRSR